MYTEPESPLSFIAELVRTALIIAILGILLRVFIVQPFEVEGNSMVPQLLNKDRLVVDKISFRLREPKRGEVIVFQYPKDPSYSFVKRVIGLPGETVRVANGKVYIINKEHPDGVELNEPYLADGIVTLPDNNQESSEFTVPEGSVYVMGDNRTASSDSRMWKELPESYITGRVLFVILPLDRFQFAPHATYDNLSFGSKEPSIA